jgi:hypothetical protein
VASGADESRTATATAVAPGDGRGGAPAAALGHDIGPGVERAAEVAPYERTSEDPPARPLRIFALDPSASSLEGAVAVVKVPFEPIASGFRGTLFEVSPRDGGNGLEYQPLDLDDRATLLGEGRAPSPSDPLFHQQMVYAVSSLVYAAFQAALGRQVAWARFGPPADSHPTRLRLSPYAARDENAHYDNEAGELRFGYFRAREAGAPGTPPRGWVFTSLSHDVVAHEVTHALLDGLRADLIVPTGPDVPAFHEGFADLVALLQRLTSWRRSRSGGTWRPAATTPASRSSGARPSSSAPAARSAT